MVPHPIVAVTPPLRARLLRESPLECHGLPSGPSAPDGPSPALELPRAAQWPVGLSPITSLTPSSTGPSSHLPEELPPTPFQVHTCLGLLPGICSYPSRAPCPHGLPTAPERPWAQSYTLFNCPCPPVDITQPRALNSRLCVDVVGPAVTPPPCGELPTRLPGVAASDFPFPQRPS